MKIKIGDKVYLQKYEVAHILHSLDSFPGCIFDEAFSGGEEVFYMCGPVDGYRFDCVFKEPESIEWLMDQDWIVDYDEYAKMSLTELEALRERLDKELSEDIEKFNAMDEDYRKEHYDEASDKFNKTGHIIASFEDFAKFRNGEIEFGFPDGYSGGTAAPPAPASIDITDADTTCTNPKRHSFFARLFRRNAQ